MKKARCYYSASVKDFLAQSSDEILGVINRNSLSAGVTEQQQSAWIQEIDILKRELATLEEGRILFEYTIPRKGKRVDVVLLYHNIVFLLEFKCGGASYLPSIADQVIDYALDLHYFQTASYEALIVPVMVPTEAKTLSLEIRCKDRVLDAIGCGAKMLAVGIRSIVVAYPNESPFDYEQWEHAEYSPTPTIIEAAQALYSGHGVESITRSDAGAENLTKTTSVIDAIIERSKRLKEKAICFVTGVPGAGKTLVGLNLAVQHSAIMADELAVFLSGNYSLVKVLQEALARDSVEQSRSRGKYVKKEIALRETSTFIQIIHTYRDFFVSDSRVPRERIVIFDEAQRAWTQRQIAAFMKSKKGILDFAYSEPEFLIQTMDRHDDWAVVVCLIGGGQEINKGEAGLPEWFEALQRSFPNWRVYISPQLNSDVYTRGKCLAALLDGLYVTEYKALHLASSIRSFRAPALSDFIDALLSCDTVRAQTLRQSMGNSYPIVITRNLARAKMWIRAQCRGTTRYGLLASSGALRLKAEGIFVKNEIAVEDWFLNARNDVRASYQLEDVATEFDVQGLELDYTLVVWDADFYYDTASWHARSFRGANWCVDQDPEKIRYRQNAYRVLLTRARQGMVLVVPYGDPSDMTRKPVNYDGTYAYLHSLGIPDLSELDEV